MIQGKSVGGEIYVYKNIDKQFHEDADPNNLGFMPHPFRCILTAPPNSGKSTLVKNILLQHYKPGKKPWDQLVCIHELAGTTEEYDDVDGIVMLDRVPESFDEFKQLAPGIENNKIKTCVIVEDVNIMGLNKHQMNTLDRVYGAQSTHFGVSIVCCAQNPISVPVSLRRQANYLVTWQYPNPMDLRLLAQRFGVELDQLRYIFKNVFKDSHDCLVISMSDKPKLRYNLFYPLT
jgi:hypothetical protein